MSEALMQLSEKIGGDFVPTHGERINQALAMIIQALSESEARTAEVAKQQLRLAERLDAVTADVRDVQHRIAAGGLRHNAPVAAAAAASPERQLEAAGGSGAAPDSAAASPELTQLLQGLQQRLEQQKLQLDRLFRGSVIVVDQAGAGLFTAIPPALAVARDGDTIVVRPGDYADPLVLDKPGVHVRGVGRGEVMLSHSEEACTVVFRAAATLSGVSIRSSVPYFCAVRFEQGEGAELVDCDVSSVNLSCIIVAGGCPSPVIRDCAIHGSKQHGISCKHDTRPHIEGNEIFDNGQPNIVVESGADPLIVRNKIHSSGQNGVWFRNASRGQLRDNEIYGNAYSNVDILADATPHIEGNRIHSSLKCGVCVAEQGGGTIRRNEIYGNNYSNVGIMAGATPQITYNRVHGSKQHGVLVKANAQGIIEDNVVYENALANIKMEDGASTVSRNNTK
eukprot:TRINITY_DN10274_c0_g1_i1.p1 TRINITY_DN10274_c0_g1~~TRINITY_DN10274_c0_g1_i1.p1  ORF type:complete len:482 (+),score=193.27 TRINITY_DN10274_c0_g1_i1:95-1447(+)